MSWLEPFDDRAARRFVGDVRHRAEATRDDLAEHATDFARHAREAVEPHLRKAGDIVRREAPVVADAALRQATRMAKAARRDPVPVMVGAIGIALIASLIFGRRRT